LCKPIQARRRGEAYGLVFIIEARTKYQLLQCSSGRRISFTNRVRFSARKGAAESAPRKAKMNTPVVMLVNVVLWSFGISAALLAGVMLIDWLSSRRIVRDRASLASAGAEIQARIESAQAMAIRLQQSSAQRRRASVITPAAKAA
jgi:hypothetical protein